MCLSDKREEAKAKAHRVDDMWKVVTVPGVVVCVLARLDEGRGGKLNKYTTCRACLSSIQQQNSILYRFVANSSQMTWRGLIRGPIWCHIDLKEQHSHCILFRGFYVGEMRGGYICSYATIPSLFNEAHTTQQPS